MLLLNEAASQPENVIIPQELGICEFTLPPAKPQGIDFIMFVVESIYNDKALQPLLVQGDRAQKRPLFKQQQ